MVINGTKLDVTGEKTRRNGNKCEETIRNGKKRKMVKNGKKQEEIV